MSTTHSTRLEHHPRREHERAHEKAVTVAGVHITHPDRPVFPSLGITKEGLARYYAEIAAWMLPRVRGRPLTLVRAPAGAEAPAAVTRHTHASVPLATPLRRVGIRDKSRTEEYLVVESAEALVALAQLDVLEVHTWNATVHQADAPDRLVFDLDPGPGVTWDRVVEAARTIRHILARLDLASYPKTTGGRGLHVVVPLAPRAGWDECLAFSRAVANRIAREDPRRFTASMVRSARLGKIYVDYLRNHRTASCIAEYSTRALRDAPVAEPITWDELGPSTCHDTCTIENVLHRIRRRGRDPWSGYDDTPQRLRVQLIRAVDSLRL
jgi:bifunctional non-homologous end joining protein LigD